MKKLPEKHKGVLTRKEYGEMLIDRLHRLGDDDAVKREVIIELGEMRYRNSYEVLEGYVKTELRHQALISMAKLDYEKAIEAVKKITADDIRKLEIKDTLECIVVDRIDNVGKDEFLKELKVFEKLGDYTRIVLYGAIKKGIALTEFGNSKVYLTKVKKILSI